MGWPEMRWKRILYCTFGVHEMAPNKLDKAEKPVCAHCGIPLRRSRYEALGGRVENDPKK